MENIKNLFRLYFRPADAMGDIIDNGSWVFAAVLVLFVSLAFFATVNSKLQTIYRIPSFAEFYHPNVAPDEENSVAERAELLRAENQYRQTLAARPQIPIIGDTFFRFFSFEPNRFYQPLLAISCFYVPLTILLRSLFGGVGNFGVVLRRDYAMLATSTLMAYAAAHLPFAVAGILLYPQVLTPEIYLLMWTASGVLFGVLMIFALRTNFGASFTTAILVICLSWLAFSLAMYVFRLISPLIFSPFLLIYAYMYFGGAISGEARGIGNAFRQRQNFKRYLQTATINPHDADAHVQLGLIYLQRRQTAKAVEHLKKAVEIEPNEVDANYELGKIARQNGDLQAALDHFSIVVAQNDKHALSEIWREIGATYFAAKMFTEARNALEKFVERRPTDTEGLYYLGATLQAQNEPEKARETFEQAIESARTAAGFARSEQKKWANLARQEIK